MTDEEDDFTDDQIVSKIKEIIEEGNNLSVKISVRMIIRTNSSLFFSWWLIINSINFFLKLVLYFKIMADVCY